MGRKEEGSAALRDRLLLVHANLNGASDNAPAGHDEGPHHLHRVLVFALANCAMNTRKS